MSSEEPSPIASSIAIAGAGIIGLSIAWRLAQRGWRVTVFDKGAAGGEASLAGAGMLPPGGEIDAPSELASLAIESRKLYPSFVRELTAATKLPIDFQECGALDLAFSDRELQALESRASRQAELGIESKPVQPQEIRASWPRLNIDNLTGARFYPGDAFVNPREVVLALASACRQLGVSIVQVCAVRSARVGRGSVSLETGDGAYRHRALVVAAGAWSDSIDLAGVPDTPFSEPVKGHLIGYQQPPQTCSTIVRHAHTYLLQRASGLLIVGSSTERVGFRRDLDPSIVSSLARRAEMLLPHLAKTSPSETWAGFRPGSDALHIGPWHSNRLYLAYGHLRNGILLAPITANRIAAEIQARLGTP